MARRRPLRTHLLSQHSRFELRTACGMTAVPQVNQQFFEPCEHTTRWEGVVPASVGVGIVVASSLGFDYTRAPGGLCNSCEQRYAHAEGI